MYATPEQFAAANKASVDALFTIAHAQFAAFERLSALNFNTTKAAFEDSVNQAKALLSVKDAQELVNLTAASAQPSLEKAIAYSRNVYEVATQTQAEVTKLAETQAAEMNKTVVSLMDKLTKNAPAGSLGNLRGLHDGYRFENLLISHGRLPGADHVSEFSDNSLGPAQEFRITRFRCRDTHGGKRVGHAQKRK